MSIFNQNNRKRRNNNQFDLSYEKKMSGKFGVLMPFYMEETLPGDRVNLRAELKTEFAPLLSQLDHLIDVHTDYFYVPYDSIWDNWRDFISGGELNDQNPTLPYVTYNESNKSYFKTGTLADYLGLPCWDQHATAPTVTGSINYNALPFRAYHHIYNNWYRDQDLITETNIQKSLDGAQGITAIGLLQKSAWQNDLFSSCRPEAQKGDPVNFLARDLTTDPNVITNIGTGFSAGAITASAATTGGAGGTDDGYLKDAGGTSLDLYATVAQLRRGEALQAFYEAMQKGGNRYNEYLNTMWGVDDQDSRLHIPQLIHSASNPLKLQEVLTTTNADNTTTDDNVAGQAYGRLTSYVADTINFTAPDYGIIMGIVKYVPRPVYLNPLRELWTRTDRLEWYTDHLAEIGEAPVLKRELYLDLTSPAGATSLEEFGYHHRYHAFKTRHDEISGDYKFGLNYRHMSRDVTSYPVLGQNFIEIGGAYDTTSLTRIFNVIDPTLDYIWIQVFNDATYSRDVKYNSTPLS